MKKQLKFLIGGVLAASFLAACNKEDKKQEEIENKCKTPIISLSNDVISWSKVDNASKYAVYENDAFLCNVLNNTFTISLTESGTYTYYIVARGNEGFFDSEKSNEVSYTYENENKLETPTLVIYDKMLTWGLIEGATYYYISQNDEYLATVTTNSYLIGDVETGGYTYTVQAGNASGVSEISNYVTYMNTSGVSKTSKTSWSRAEMISDWALKGSIDESVQEGYDLLDNSEASILTTITDNNRYLVLDIRTFVRSGETAPDFSVQVNGRTIREMDSSTDYVSPYTDVPKTFGYDLSEYVGEDVFIKIKQVRGSHCCITSLNLLKEYGPTLARSYEWTKNELFDEWLTSGISLVNEGPDFKDSGYASIKVHVTEQICELHTDLRMFAGQDELPAKWGVKINGTLICAQGATNNYVSINNNTDATQTFIYDLSQFIGQVVRVRIESNSPQVNHCVLLGVKFTAKNGANPVSSNLNWNFKNEESIQEWSIKHAQIINEGVDLKSSGTMSLYIDVSNENAYLKLRSRMFIGQDSLDARLLFMVNSLPQIPVGSESETITMSPTTDDSLTTYFDLSGYIGQTIKLTVRAYQENVNHCVIEQINLLGAIN